MTTTEIIRHICSETGIDFTGKESLDLVPLNDLNVHKTEVWHLGITSTPELYFSKISAQCHNKISYRFKFGIQDVGEGLMLCRGLKQELGLSDTGLPSPEAADAQQPLYLAIHIHPEFAFTPKTRACAATQALKLCFV